MDLSFSMELQTTHSLLIELIAIFGALAAGMLVVVYGSIVKNRRGMSLNPAFCPRCKTQLAVARKPLTRRQALWGGWTCPTCGTEVDKWGREIL